MALIYCPECGNRISDAAVKCICCGFPINFRKKDVNLFRTNEVVRLNICRQAEEFVDLFHTITKSVVPDCISTFIPIKDPRQPRIIGRLKLEFSKYDKSVAEFYIYTRQDGRYVTIQCNNGVIRNATPNEHVLIKDCMKEDK